MLSKRKTQLFYYAARTCDKNWAGQTAGGDNALARVRPTRSISSWLEMDTVGIELLVIMDWVGCWLELQSTYSDMFAKLKSQYFDPIHYVSKPSQLVYLCSPICQEGAKRKNIPDFSSFSRFFLISPSFSRFLANFLLTPPVFTPL